MGHTVALIGGGGIGRVHARHWQALPDVEVVAILDPRGHEARVAGDPPHFSDWDTMLGQTKPDIIDICTPTSLHREYIERAAASGKATFCEKPLARTLADCDAIVDVVRRSGIPFMVGHVVRFFPEFAAAKRLVDAGGIGSPVAVRVARMGGMPGQGRPENWYGSYAGSGGVILDLMLHDFDWLRWCFGDVQRVFAKGLYQQLEFEGQLDYALVTLRFKSGVVGHLTGSWAHPSGLKTSFEIAGDGGMIDQDSTRTTTLNVGRRNNIEEGDLPKVVIPRNPLAPLDDPYYQELGSFLEAIRNGTPSPVTVEDGREAVRIALAALESIETGKVVTL